MKKRTAVLLGCLLILSLAACGNPQEPQAAAQSNSIAASSQSESLADEGEDAAQAPAGNVLEEPAVPGDPIVYMTNEIAPQGLVKAFRR